MREQSWLAFFMILVCVSCVSATTYYVAPEGNDARSCRDATSPETPRQTPNEAIKCLVSGDTLIFGAGVYERASLLSDQPQVTAPIPSGLSATQPTTLKATEGATVVLRPTDRAYPGGGGVLTLVGAGTRYITFDGLTIDGNAIDVASAQYQDGVLIGGTVSALPHGYGVLHNNAHHITYRRMVIRNANIGVLGGGESTFDDIEVVSNGLCITNKPQASENQEILAYYLKCAPDIPAAKNFLTGHGLYITTANNRFTRLHIHHNGGYGIQLFGTAPHFNILRDSVIHDNAQTSQRGGISISGNSNQILNTVLYREHFCGTLYTGNPTLIAHTTCYAAGTRLPPHPERPGWYLRDATSATRFLFNLILATPYPLRGAQDFPPATDTRTTVIQQDATAVVDASQFDFRLRAESVARGTMAPIPEALVDIRGVTREHADAGAYAYVSLPPPAPPAPSVSRVRVHLGESVITLEGPAALWVRGWWEQMRVE